MPSNSESLPFSVQDADLKILVTYREKLTVLEVSSAAMSLASPVWKMFIQRRRGQDFEIQRNDETIESQIRSSREVNCRQAGSPKHNGGVDTESSIAKRARKSSKNDEMRPQEESQRGVHGGNPAVSSATLQSDDTIQNCNTVARIPEEPIDFTTDKFTALLVLLNISHLQFDEVSTRFTHETLAEIAILCDQYDCIKLVKPWLSRWVSMERYTTSIGHIGYEQWLTISWIFGHRKIFETLALKLVSEVKLKTTGEVEELRLTASGHPFPDVFPLEIVDKIFAIRALTLSTLLGDIYYHLERSSSVDYVGCTKGSPKQCDSMALGSLIHNLAERSLWPKKTRRDIETSINDFAPKLKHWKIEKYEFKELFKQPVRDPGYHRHCGIPASFDSAVDHVLSSIKPPVVPKEQESHYKSVKPHSAILWERPCIIDPKDYS